MSIARSARCSARCRKALLEDAGIESCLACRKYISVDSNGDVYTCAYLPLTPIQRRATRSANRSRDRRDFQSVRADFGNRPRGTAALPEKKPCCELPCDGRGTITRTSWLRTTTAIVARQRCREIYMGVISGAR